MHRKALARFTLLATFALAPFASVNLAAESRERPGSEAQQRFERAQQHSDLQDLKATLDRQRAAIRSQRHTGSASSGDRARQSRELRKSRRTLQQQQQGYQRPTHEPATDR